MSDRDWQHAVLRDLGAAGTGLADPRPPDRLPLPAPIGDSATPPTPAERVTGTSPSIWYPEGSVIGEETAAETAPPVLGAPLPPGREATAVFGLPPKDSLRSQPAPPDAPNQPADERPAVPRARPPAPVRPDEPVQETPAHDPGQPPEPSGPSYGPGGRPHVEPPRPPAALSQRPDQSPAVPPPFNPDPAASRQETPGPPAGFGGDQHVAGRPVDEGAGEAQPASDRRVAGWGADQQAVERPGPDPDATMTDPPPLAGQPSAPEAASPVIGSPEEPASAEAAGQWAQPPAAASRPVPPVAPVAPDALVRRQAHGDSALRRVGRGVRKAVGASAAGDARQRAGMAQRLQSPVASCRRIAVTSIRGGAGKTTVAALLASVIAEHREDRVLAMDADSGLGSLPLRLGVQTERSLEQLAAAQPRSWEETAQFLAPTEQGLWVASGSANGQVAELDLETFQQAASRLIRYFSTAVIDCGAGIVARLQRGVLAAAHAQVFVTPATVDGALSARQTLGWFVGSGYEDLLSRTVVAVVTHSPHADGDADLERARQVISDGGLPVVVVPYDRHLATGTAIAPARVSGAARAAVAWIAAEAFARSLSGGTA